MPIVSGEKQSFKPDAYAADDGSDYEEHKFINQGRTPGLLCLVSQSPLVSFPLFIPRKLSEHFLGEVGVPDMWSSRLSPLHDEMEDGVGYDLKLWL
jgi:hypothetical protein